MSTRRFYSCGREGDEGGEELTLPSRNDVLSLTLFCLSTFPLFRMIFHNVSDSGPTGSASSWISDIFSLPSLPTSILNSLTSSSSPTSSTFPPSALASGFKWGFGSSSSQGREEVKRPGQEGDLRVEDRESFSFLYGLKEEERGRARRARGAVSPSESSLSYSNSREEDFFDMKDFLQGRLFHRIRDSRSTFWHQEGCLTSFSGHGLSLELCPFTSLSLEPYLFPPVTSILKADLVLFRFCSVLKSPNPTLLLLLLLAL